MRPVIGRRNEKHSFVDIMNAFNSDDREKSFMSSKSTVSSWPHIWNVPTDTSIDNVETGNREP